MAVLSTTAILLTGCGGTGTPTQARPAAAGQVPATAPQLTITPADGATAVAPAAPIRVETSSGALSAIALTATNGKVLPGVLSPDGRTWTASAPPAFGTTYRFTGTATGDGGSTPVTGGFTTVAPKRTVHASTNIGDGTVVGIAAPVEISFDRKIAVADRPAAERALQITTTAPVEGSWGWLVDDWQNGSRVHWRPAAYWPAGTGVTVTAHLFGVDLGAAGFGANDLTSAFTIGRAQIVKADVNTHRIVVFRDGQVVADLPASYGSDSDSRRVTRSGVHIVMAKSQTVLMSNPAFGYTNVPMHWAVRISYNGEFIHANPASTYAQGKTNVTHGCVNLSTANAKSYYDTAIYGDPVEVTGSRIPLSAADGDVYDWAIPLDQWKTMSALS